MLFALAFALPFVLIVGFMLWAFLRRSPERRAKILFVQIVNHTQKVPACQPHYAKSFGLVWSAVQDCDIPYLKAYLKNLRNDFPH